MIPGHEFSREVAPLGEGVRAVGVGEAVYGMNDWFGDRAQAEYCLAGAADIARKRARPAAAWHVLTHGAAGGVGLFAVQLARWREYA